MKQFKSHRCAYDFDRGFINMMTLRDFKDDKFWVKREPRPEPTNEATSIPIPSSLRQQENDEFSLPSQYSSSDDDEEEINQDSEDDSSIQS